MNEVENNMPVQEPEKPDGDFRTEVYDWLQCIVTALLACILIFTFGARVIGVVGISMENTLIEGDRLLISDLFYTPKQGDIVVLRKDAFMSAPIVKRVIATEGQTVDIDFTAGVVYVDGVALEEPYIKEPTYNPKDFTGPVTVPEGHVFVMGDNRNHSDDSRVSRLGMVDEGYIMGRMLLRIWPISKFGSVD